MCKEVTIELAKHLGGNITPIQFTTLAVVVDLATTHSSDLIEYLRTYSRYSQRLHASTFNASLRSAKCLFSSSAIFPSVSPNIVQTSK